MHIIVGGHGFVAVHSICSPPAGATKPGGGGARRVLADFCKVRGTPASLHGFASASGDVASLTSTLPSEAPGPSITGPSVPPSPSCPSDVPSKDTSAVASSLPASPGLIGPTSITEIGTSSVVAASSDLASCNISPSGALVSSVLVSGAPPSGGGVSVFEEVQCNRNTASGGASHRNARTRRRGYRPRWSRSTLHTYLHYQSGGTKSTNGPAWRLTGATVSGHYRSSPPRTASTNEALRRAQLGAAALRLSVE
jgi:hypothetical protein